MSLEDRAARAATLKAKGNTAYQQKKFAVAAELYTRAIAVTPRPEPVFFSNRAACYINMSPPLHHKVVEDCDAALKLDSTYVKALNRRATALEALEKYKESLRDFTAATILDKFQNATAAQAVERVLKKMATVDAATILQAREPRLPANSFVAAYFAAFRARPLPVLPDAASTADNQLLLSLQALEAGDYTHSHSLINEALDGHEPSWAQGKAEAYNLRGTFRFLAGDSQGAKEDLEKATKLVPSFTQSWVKIASVHMEQGDAVAAFAAFDSAIQYNKDDPDIYYHRGQVYFIMNEFSKAAEDYIKSTSLDERFVFSHIQLAVAQYKSDNIANSMATFRRALKAFPDRSEPANYYGELLLDQQRYKEAIEKFDRAFELEKTKKKAINVLPLVNKSLAIFQEKQDITAAVQLCREALQIDPECEAAVATIAQLSLQQGHIDEAVKMFDRHCELARTEPELVNALTYKYASAAQMEFMKNYPHLASQMGQLAQSLM
ncbi:mitochondrial outer membrane translocase receptor TOM70 [Sistotremastrum niveocremeum HHB9708]|uniref:Mitochondrial outer membrane translocase receptor TOM70 n=2 Tax=Sistotremastraceae TaxID=3402574 RepID=A0A164WSD8_9AGAM|nr:mitochondrial outer membrane translocase receptor TOM70 [Sistotremastrum niveocremeum HHB9708]KZT38395.1 mitochondrial outer membrane translocase receptor TOM70 [Sistotremastrum suecicum HHB10207 ss-3]